MVVDPRAHERMVKGDFRLKALMIGGSEGEYDQMFLNMDEAETKVSVLQRNQDKQVSEADLDRFAELHPEMNKKEAYMSAHNQLGLTLGGEWIARACCRHIPVYQYQFRLRDPKEGWRSLHGAPCAYVFGNLIPDRAPEKLSEQMMDVWAAFLTSGKPDCPAIPEWPPYSADGPVMAIDENWIVENGF